MEWLSGDLLKLINALLPGFVAAWVFYGLTAHKVKEQAFERVVQALIFTVLIHSIVIPIGWGWQHIHRLGNWTDQHALVASVLVALLLGLFISLLAHTDWLFTILRKITLSRRTADPSQWYSVFHRHQNYVILHLKGEDHLRIKGWPDQWPDSPEIGHFVLQYPAWVQSDGSDLPITQTERFVVPVTEVIFVEFLCNSLSPTV